MLLKPFGGGGGADPVVELPGLCGFRLTLESGVPVSTSDQAAKTTVYLTPNINMFSGLVSLYSGSVWELFMFSEVSLAVPSTTDTNYDIFAYDSSGLTLEAVAWTSDTARTTALVQQDEVFVKSGATERLYVGSIRTTGTSGQCEDTTSNRFVWNTFNRVARQMKVVDTTDTWSYGTGTWRNANGDTTAFVGYLCGLADEGGGDESNSATMSTAIAAMEAGNDDCPLVGIGIDAVTMTGPIEERSQRGPDGNVVNSSNGDSMYGLSQAARLNMGQLGYHELHWAEYVVSGTVTFVGDSGGTDNQTGLIAEIMA